MIDLIFVNINLKVTLSPSNQLYGASVPGEEQ